jgi:uncharacterized membrane protein YhaH (DUF805 family)
MEYNKIDLKELFQIKGFYSRKQWWLIVVFIFFLNFFVIYITSLMVLSEQVLITALGTVLMFGTIMGTFFLQIFSSIKRLHDANLSGWFTLFYLLPYLGPLIIMILCGFLGSSRLNNKYEY